ncbi:MAG: quinone-dependent dihydroorotate dehydrogenase [Hyphomicrobiales bacterium]|nr:quinone-dependent dihydroorotate dehydrogenase [Hyphomicrobiales bacterium]
MISLFSLAQPGLFLLEPEQAHEATLRALEAGVHPRARTADPVLRQSLWGLSFPNPIGMAAGFDKDARVCDALLAVGFGFVEVGTVTPRPQPGNPRPRVFRLMRERALINRLGFNSGGHAPAIARLSTRAPAGVVGVNIGPNKDAADPIEDIVAGVRAFANLASYLTINISSPNTPGLRGLQAPERLDVLLQSALAERDAHKPGLPVLVKLAPDMDDAALDEAIALLMERRVSGAVLTNTTVDRAGVPPSAHRGESGGLSGEPLFRRSTRFLARAYRASGGRLPLIGVGGVHDGETALQKILAGASLIQLYTGLIYAGPGLVPAANAAIAAYLSERGFSRISDAVGARSDEWADAKV